MKANDNDNVDGDRVGLKVILHVFVYFRLEIVSSALVQPKEYLCPHNGRLKAITIQHKSLNLVYRIIAKT